MVTGTASIAPPLGPSVRWDPSPVTREPAPPTLAERPRYRRLIPSGILTPQQQWPSSPADGSSVTTPIKRALEIARADQVLIPNPDEVRDYLTRFPDTLEVMQVACAATVEQFDASAEISLEVYHDPEIEDEHLIIYVRREQYEEDIMEAIESASVVFEDALIHASGWLLITTDFQPPRIA